MVRVNKELGKNCEETMNYALKVTRKFMENIICILKE